MAKVEWSQLEIVEEWPPIDPSNPELLHSEAAKLRDMIALMLKVYRKEIVEEVRRNEKRIDRVRRETGLNL